MTALSILLAAAGGVITIMVVAGMVFLTPRGVEAHTQTSETQLGFKAEPQTSANANAGASPRTDHSLRRGR